MKSFVAATFLYLCFTNLSADAQNKNILSDNRLKSHIDSAVDLGAKHYMDTPNTVGLSIGARRTMVGRPFRTSLRQAQTDRPFYIFC